MAVVSEGMEISERLRTHNGSTHNKGKTDSENIWVFRTLAPHISLVHGWYFYYRKKF